MLFVYYNASETHTAPIPRQGTEHLNGSDAPTPVSSKTVQIATNSSYLTEYDSNASTTLIRYEAEDVLNENTTFNGSQTNGTEAQPTTDPGVGDFEGELAKAYMYNFIFIYKFHKHPLVTFYLSDFYTGLHP